MTFPGSINVADYPERLSNARLLAYGFPAAPLSFLWIPIILWIPAFYTQELGLNLTIVGLIFLIARLWDGVSDPIVGALSDRLETRFGRRKPWLIGGTAFLVIASYYLQKPPESAGSLYLFVSIIAFYTFWTIVQIPHMAWAADLSPKYRERSRIAGFRSFGSMLGILLASVLPILILGEAASPGNALALYADVIAFLLPITIIIAVLFVPERKTLRDESDWRSVIAALVKNRTLRVFLLAFFLWDIALALFEIPMLFLVERSLQLPGQFPKLLAIDYCCAIAMTPVTVMLSNKLGKHRMFAISGCLFALGCLVLLFIPPREFYYAVAGYVLIGFGISGFWAIPVSMVADLSDLGRLESGEDQAGLYMAAFNLTWKLAMAAGAAIGLPLLDVFGFDASVSANNEGVALYSLKIVGLMLPIVLLLCSALVLWRYPLTEDAHDKIRRQLGAARSTTGKARDQGRR